MNARLFIAVLALLLGLLAPVGQAEARGARSVYHAGGKAWKKSVEARGLSMSKARGSARFGKGAYFSLARKGALRERPRATAVYRGRITRTAWSRRLDTRRLDKAGLRRASGRKDLRGTMKNGVIGNRLGKAIGRRASKEGRVVMYRARGTKRAWANVYVPAKAYRTGKVVPRLKER